MLPGEFKEQSHTQSSNPTRNVDCLRAPGEETDTWIIFHAVNSTIEYVVETLILCFTHLLAFHAITGCDSTKLVSITKEGAWKVFSGENCDLLAGLDRWALGEDLPKNVQAFVVKLYRVSLLFELSFR